MTDRADQASAEATDVERLIEAIDVESARSAIADVALRTPTIVSDELSQAAGGTVVLKAECLQRTGSFKLRGALNKIAALGEAAPAGVVTASAGNHGQAVAYAARARGLRCEVFVPRDAAVSKVASIELLGGAVRIGGDTVEDALATAIARAAETGDAFVHPFDDVDVIAGQGTLALELLEDVANLRRVLVPIGGGGLASGIGVALKRQVPDAELVGVQAQVCAPFADPSAPLTDAALTIADGIAVKRPGLLTSALLRELLDDVCVVAEDEIAAGMVFLAGRARLVAEGAGAVGVAALLAGRLEPLRSGTTAVILSGGNVDSGLLAAILRRNETELGRRVRIFTRIPDRPGGLAELLGLVAAQRANLITIEHMREAVPLHVRETAVELTLETRGPAHTEQLLAALHEAGYETRTDAPGGDGA
jgi:threonine dehydratase